jgi:hypothetical protein
MRSKAKRNSLSFNFKFSLILPSLFSPVFFLLPPPRLSKPKESDEASF